jgi:hypothetical protein
MMKIQHHPITATISQRNGIDDFGGPSFWSRIKSASPYDTDSSFCSPKNPVGLLHLFYLYHVLIFGKKRHSPAVFFDFDHLPPQPDRLVLDGPGIELEPVPGVVIDQGTVFRGDHVSPVDLGHLGVGDSRLHGIGHKVTVKDQEDTDGDPDENRLELAEL